MLEVYTAPLDVTDFIAPQIWQTEAIPSPGTLTFRALVTEESSTVERVIVLDSGRIMADGPKEQVLEALRQGQIRAARS